MCICVTDGNKKYAHVGNIIIGVVKDALLFASIKQSKIVRALIVRIRNFIFRKNGISIRFDKSTMILSNIQKNFSCI